MSENTEQDLTSPDGVTALMESSKSADEWNANCNAVKKANNGYPGFWYPMIMMSGLAANTEASWK